MIFICKVNLKKMSIWNKEPDSWFSGVKRLLPLLNGEIGPTLFDEVVTGFSEMEDALELLERRAPNELVSEYEISGGTKVRKIGPIVYGYSMSIGPEGKPVVREFGSVKRGHIHGLNVEAKPSRSKIGGEREPMIDVLSTEGNVRVTVEMPGVEKEKIKIDAYDNTVEVISLEPTRKYHKSIDLPTEVDVKTARSKYNNGILEITFDKKKETKSKGKQIKIE
jgi:HSP20 family protein